MDIPTLIDLLDEYGFADSDSGLKLSHIQGAIWQIEGHKPWPFLETSVDLNFNGSSGTATNLPSDFRAALRLKDLSTGDRITPVRLDDAEDHIGKEYTEVGNPSFYYFEGGQLKVWPLPTSGDARLRLKYIRWSTAVTEASEESDILIPKQYHEAILYGALLRLLDSEDDPELSVRYQGHYDLRLQQMESTLFQLQFDRPDVIAITDPDDWDFYH
jgi:hypothetical protein